MEIDRGEGYCPHPNSSFVFCPKCGKGEFVAYPQAIPYGGDRWTYEYTCANCGHILAITVLDWRKR